MILLSSSPNLPLTLNPSKTSDKVECRLPQEQYHACNRFRSQMKDSNQEFANSNTCCPGVEDQWQGRAPSDILTSESKQLNILNLHSHVDFWNGAWLISKRDNTNVHECDQLLNAFKFPPVRDVANAYAQCRAVFSKLQASFLSCRVACQLLNLHTHCEIWNRAYFNEVFFFFKSVCNWLR